MKTKLMIRTLFFSVVFTVPSLFAYNSQKLGIPNVKHVLNSNKINLNADKPVGTLPGKIEVNKIGALTYSIPIDTPPGTAGLIPNLAIGYNSQNRQNGMMGVGFTLQGLSAINRTSADLTHNGYIHGVDYTSKDRFSYHGQPLVALNHATYGGNGTEYRTYLDSFAKIISYDAQGNGPAKFKVWSKGGLIEEYGYTSDAQTIVPVNNTVASWHLNKVEDRLGNYYTIKYQQADHIAYPLQIDYTGNPNSDPALTPYNSIKFIYTDQSQPITKYHAGVEFKTTKLLQKIEIYEETNLVYTYNFNYTQNPVNHKYYLNYIQKCSGAGTCLPVTQFTWPKQATQLPTESVWQADNNYRLFAAPIVKQNQDNGVRFVDLNNNGKPDLMFNNGINSGAWLNQDGQWKSSTKYNLPAAAITKNGKDNGVRFVDLDGNGSLDVIFNNGYNNGVWLNKNGTWESSTNYAIPHFPVIKDGKDNGVRFTEFQGNALPGLLFSNGMQTSSVRKNDKGWQDTTYKLPQNLTFVQNGKDTGVRLIDLNSDGLPDLVHSTDTAKHQVWLNDNQTWVDSNYQFPVNLIQYGKPQAVQFVDLNNDGLPDIVAENNGRTEIWLNKGDGTWQTADYQLPTITAGLSLKEIRFIDLNGDGLPDIIYSTISGSDAWLNTGHGWTQEATPFKMPNGTFITVNSGQNNGVRFVDLDGNGLLDIMFNNGIASGAWLNTANPNNNAIEKITNGLGENTSITYKSITDTSAYNAGTEPSKGYPNIDYQRPSYVVSTISVDNGDGGQHVTRYQYSAAKMNLRGLDFLGFHQIKTTDEDNGIYAIKTFDQDPSDHTINQPVSDTSYQKNGSPIASIDYTWACKSFGDGTPEHTYYQPYTKTEMSKHYSLTGTLLNTNTVDFTPDDYGNPTKIITTINDNIHSKTYTTTLQNTYNINTDGWLIEELTHKTITKEATNQLPITQSASFSYYANGLLKQGVTEPDQIDLSVTKDYQYDIFGNLTTTAISGKDIQPPRTTKILYDAKGEFPTKEFNALDQPISQKFDKRFGEPTETINLNGNKTTYQYDDFGRLIRSTLPDNTITTQQYEPCTMPSTSCPANAVYFIQTQHTGDKPHTKFFDKLDRMVAKTTQGLNGQIIRETVHYNQLGQIDKIYLPYFDGNPQYYITKTYDLLNRPTTIVRPDGAPPTTIKYTNYITTVTNALYQNNTEERNAVGELIKTIDNAKNPTSYVYNAAGKLTQVTDSNDNKTQMEYDPLGRKIAMTDPDTGVWRYQYDVLNKLTQETKVLDKDHPTDPSKNLATTFGYDKLGRMISRTDHYGTPAAVTSAWEYGSGGQLIKINGVSNITGHKTNALDLIHAIKDGVVNYQQDFSYDNLSRLTKTITTINGAPYNESFTYDPQTGKMNTITYPNGVVAKNHYNNLGYLTNITNGDNSKTYWQLNGMDAEGHITSVTHSNSLTTAYQYNPKNGFLTNISTTQPTLSNHKINTNKTNLFYSGLPIQDITYTYNALGNLTQTKNIVTNQTINYKYDSLNRLTTATPTQGNVLTYNYDNLGNITYKSDTGTYYYDKINAGPHAVTSIKNDSTTTTFTYDKSGNQISKAVDGKNKRQMTYTSYGKPLKITDDNNHSVNYYYNADRSRFMRVDDNDSQKTTTLYLGGYTLVTNPDGTIEEKNYIGPNTLIITQPTTKGTTETYDLLHDHLGSITAITDASGKVLQRYQYSPFGQQKTLTNLTHSDPFSKLTSFGFTNQEEISSMQLIHMNGRIYDPTIGRFLSADPFIQAPEYSQDLNRYSYVMNNAINMVDPSGYGWWDDTTDWVSDTWNDTTDWVSDTWNDDWFEDEPQLEQDQYAENDPSPSDQLPEVDPIKPPMPEELPSLPDAPYAEPADTTIISIDNSSLPISDTTYSNATDPEPSFLEVKLNNYGPGNSFYDENHIYESVPLNFDEPYDLDIHIKGPEELGERVDNKTYSYADNVLMSDFELFGKVAAYFVAGLIYNSSASASMTYGSNTSGISIDRQGISANPIDTSNTGLSFNLGIKTTIFNNIPPNTQTTSYNLGKVTVNTDLNNNFGLEINPWGLNIGHTKSNPIGINPGYGQLTTWETIGDKLSTSRDNFRDNSFSIFRSVCRVFGGRPF